MKPNKIIVTCSLFCDDVRREDNGKRIVIGTYTKGLSVQKVPSDIGLTILVAGRTEHGGEGELPFAFRVMQDDLEIGGISATAVFEDVGEDYHPFELSFGSVGIQIQRKGFVILEMKQGDDEWVELNRLLLNAP